jgi:hypothetical protein
MNKRRYPLAEAALARRDNPWEQLSLQLKELGDQRLGILNFSHGVLAGVAVEIGVDEVIFRNLNAAQERLVARHVDDLARRLKRSVRLA